MSTSAILVVKDFLIEFNINLIFKVVSPRTVTLFYLFIYFDFFYIIKVFYGYCMKTVSNDQTPRQFEQYASQMTKEKPVPFHISLLVRTPFANLTLELVL